MKIKLSYAVLSLFVLFAGAALAQTPDGDPPSGESVCDPWSADGRAFGLCNAYCEAMDCDGSDPKASSGACERVFVNFEEYAGQAPPCVPCPCLGSSFPVFSSFADGSAEIGNCSVDDRPDDGVFVVIVNDVAGEASAEAGVDPPDAFCGSSAPVDNLLVGIADGSARACAELLRTVAEAELGTGCMPL